MASADGSILIRTKVDTNGIKTGTNAIQSGVGKINNSLLKLGSTIATVFSVYKIIQFGKQAVSLASDLQEVQNVVDVAFGDMAYKIEQFADSAIVNFGLSELSAKQMASTFMAMANGMGQELGVASDKAVEITGRLADIMSFYNKTISEVETIGRAVYSGETEPLKAIGVIMTEAQLQAFALANGYSELYKNMNAADKLLVRQAYFLSVTNQAAGDFIRTQDSWANQTRILSERWKEFLTLIGGRLIQVLTPVVTVLNNLLITAINLGNAMANIFGWQVQQSTAAGTTAGYVEDTASSQEDVASATNETNNALKKQLAYFDDINVLSSQSASGAGTSTGGTTGGGVGGGVVNTEKTTQELTALEKKMLDFLNRIKQAWQTDADFTFLGEEFAKAVNSLLVGIDWDVIKENSYKAGKAIATFLNGAIKDTDWGLVGKTIGESVNTAVSFANGVITNFDFTEAGAAFSESLNSTFETIDWEMLGETISDGTTGSLDFINEAIETFDWDGVGEDIGKGLASIDYLSILAGIGEAITKLIFEGIPEFIGGVFDGISKRLTGYDANASLGNAFKTIFNGLFSLENIKAWVGESTKYFELAFSGEEIGKNIILGLANGIGASIGLVLLPFTNILFAITELFGVHSPSTVFYEIAMYIIEGFLLGLQDFGGAILEWFDTSLTTLWDSVIAPWFSIEKWTMIGQNMQNGIKAGFKGIVGWIVGVLNGIIDGFEAMVNFVVEGANTLIDKFNSLPSAVRLGYTASRFSKVNFGNIPIPALAQGAVIPANKEFMAILGDQKSGVNIETPLQTMIDAFNTALNNRGGNNSGTVINLNVDGQTFARLTLDSFMNEMTRQGYDVAVLGG